MLRLFVMMHLPCAVNSSKPRNLTAHISINAFIKESFSEHENSKVFHTATRCLMTKQEKLWKRINKTDPALSSVLHSPDVKRRISVLAKIMDCDEADVTELVKRNNILVASDTVIEKVELVKSHGFSIQDVIANPAVLHRSLEVLKERLTSFRKLQPSGSVTLRALKFTDEAFQAYIEKRLEEQKTMKEHSSRMYFIACLLDCDENEATALAFDHNFLWTASSARLKRKVDTLLKHNVSKSFIRENLRILVHASDTELDRRLTLLGEKDLMRNDNLKLGYYLSCKSEDFVKSLRHLNSMKDALEGCENKLEYLIFRLGCSETMAKYLVCSKPISKLSEVKLKQTLDFFLLELGLKPVFVLNNKTVLSFSVKTLRERWTTLQDAGYSDQDVLVLAKAFSMSNQKFQKKFGACVLIDTFKSPEED